MLGLLLCLCGCQNDSVKSADTNFSSTKNSVASYDVSKFYKLVQNDDLTFKYYVFNTESEIVDSGSSIKTPSFELVGDHLMELCVQTGTGLSTNYAKYYDLNGSKISQIFHYVLTAKDNYVVCADYRNDKHLIIVQDIFDKEKYYKEYELENVSPVAADFVVDGYFNTNGNINITYISGDEFKESNYTILLQSK